MSDQQRYGDFLRHCASAGSLWAVWSGDDWATARDPSDPDRDLFLLWSTRERAQASLQANAAKFPAASEVEAIELQKWLDAYTPDFIEWDLRPLLDADAELRGLIVDPADLARDLVSMRRQPHLQATDLARLERAVKAKRPAGNSGSG